MRIEERIGARMREARDANGWSQEVLGKQVALYLDNPWSAQTVSVAENGGRDFAAKDLLALALVLGRPVAWFYRPNIQSTDEIKTPSVHTVLEAEMRRVYGLENKEAYRLKHELEKLAADVALLGEGEA